MCEEMFYNQADAKGGAGGTGFYGSPKSVTLMKFKGLLGYHKPHVTDYIAI